MSNSQIKRRRSAGSALLPSAVRATLIAAGATLAAPISHAACTTNVTIVTCDPDEPDHYSGGLNYQNDVGGVTLPGLSLVLNDGVIIENTGGQDGVAVEQTGNLALTTNGAVTITTDASGADRDGVRVDSENGSVTLASGANITVANDQGDGIIARSNQLDPDDPSFSTGKGKGAGAVAVDNSGTIVVTGNNATGITASSGTSGVISINNTGNVSTSGAVDSGAIVAQNANTTAAGSRAQVTSSGAVISASGNRSAGILATAAFGTTTVAVTGGTIQTQGRQGIGIGGGTGLSDIFSIGAALLANTPTGAGLTINNGTLGAPSNDGADITTAGESAYGIAAVSRGGAVNVLNRGDISTTGRAGTGIAALHSYTPNAGTTKAGPVTIVNHGAIATTGDSGGAIGAIVLSSDINITNSGALETFGNSVTLPEFSALGTSPGAGGIQAVVGRALGVLGGNGNVAITTTATGTIATHGLSADGINATSFRGNITVNAAGSIDTEGASADGIEGVTQNAGTVAITAVDVSTAGAGARAIAASTASGALAIDAASVSTTGSGMVGTTAAHGIDAKATSGAIMIDVASVTTAGNAARGISATTTSGAITINADSVSTRGNNVTFNYAEAIRAVASNGGAITVTTGNVSTGALSVDGLSLTGGTSADGIMLNTVNGGAINANTTGGTITTLGSDAEAINIVGSRAVTVTTSDVSTGVLNSTGTALLGGANSYGVLASSSGAGVLGTVTVDTSGGTVTTRGNSARAVNATSSNGPVSVTTADVTTGALGANGMTLLGGTNAYGVYASSTGSGPAGNVSVDATRGAISTRGNGAYGIRTLANGGPMNVTTADVFTGTLNADATALLGGSGAHGVSLWAIGIGADDAVVADTTAGSIRTLGDNARGIDIFSQGTAVAVTTANVSTGAVDAAGVALLGGATSHAVYVENAGTEAGNNIVIDTTGGTLTTRGDGAHGIFATTGNPFFPGNGPITITTGNISTGVLSADGVTVIGGSSSHGVFVDDHSSDPSGPISIDTTRGAVTTLGQGAYGVSVSAEASAIAIASANITTSGDDAIGVNARASGGAIAIETTAGSIATMGNRAAGIHGATDAAVSIIAGNVSTRGTAAEGVYALSRASTSTVEARGSVLATGEFSPGIVAIAQGATADVTIATGANIQGGWVATPSALGANDLTAAGVILGGAPGFRDQAAVLNNSGVIGAASDLAIVSADHFPDAPAPAAGGILVENYGTVLGYVRFGAGANVFNNYSSNSFDLRDFADTNGDGVRDTERVAIADFGGPGAHFDNAATGTLRLSTVTGATNTDAFGSYVPVGMNPLFHDVTQPGVEQGQLLNLATFRNAGVITLQDAATGGTGPVAGDILIVSGGATPGTPAGGRFISDGGELHLDTVLNEGGSGSHSDMLLVDGTQLGAGGATRVFIANAGGAGNWTSGDGIKIVDVLDPTASATGAFVLGARVAAGAFEYLLFQGGQTANGGDAQDGDWYLRNTRPVDPPSDPPGEPPNEPEPPTQPEPNYRIEVPLYSALPAMARQFGFATLDSLRERVGDNFPSEARTGERSNASWTRAFGETADRKPRDFFKHGPTYDYDIAGIQTGLDFYRSEWPNSAMHSALGAYIGIGQADGTVAQLYENGPAGSMSFDGRVLGLYWTHFAEHGGYLDAVLQGTWLENIEVQSTGGQQLRSEGWSASASLEGGYAFACGAGCEFEPQGQLIYHRVQLDDSADDFGHVAFERSDSTLGRVGARIAQTFDFANHERLSTVWSQVNVLHAFDDESATTFATTEGQQPVAFSSGTRGTWAELGLGFSAQVTAATQVYADAYYHFTIDESFGDGVSGVIGFKIVW